MPISLSANEMAMIERAAAPLDRDRRDAFIEAVMAALEGCPELGPACWDPPRLSAASHHPKSKLASGPPILASARR